MAVALLAALPLASGARVSAHRLDELLQTARIALERDRVQLELRLTPGSMIADRLIREIDADSNGALSQNEAEAYAGRVLTTLTLRVDDSPPLRLQPASSSIPGVEALRAGDGAIVIQSEAVLPPLALGRHRLSFHNGNATGASVFLANALVPEHDDIAVTGQQRAGDQSALTIEFVVREAPASSGRWAWIGLAGLLLLARPLSRRSRARLRSACGPM